MHVGSISFHIISIFSYSLSNFIKQYTISNILFHKISIINMLELYSITLQTNSKIFNKKTKRQIRFSYKNNVSTSHSICKIINESTIAWQEDIRIPLIYDQNIDFQIFIPHEFGYCPEQLDFLNYGKFYIRTGRHFGKCEVYSNNPQPKTKVGYLSIYYKKLQQQLKPQKPKISNTSDKITVSILVKNLAHVPQSGYIVMNNGIRPLKGPTIEPIEHVKGQFVYFVRFNRNFITSSKQNKIIIQFYQIDNKYVGKAVFQHKNSDKIIKARLMSSEGLRVGDVYLNNQPYQNQFKNYQQEQGYNIRILQVQSQQSIKNTKRKQEPKLKINYQYSNQPRRDTNQSQRKSENKLNSKLSDLFSQQMQIRNLTKIKSTQQSQSKTSPIYRSSSKLQSISEQPYSNDRQEYYQMLGSSRIRKKYHSIINKNGRIVFSTQKRFKQQPCDLNKKKFYSPLPKMDFFDNHSGRYYKGASIGKGNKHDFTKQKINYPGVGQYKIPSIFDYY